MASCVLPTYKVALKGMIWNEGFEMLEERGGGCCQRRLEIAGRGGCKHDLLATELAYPAVPRGGSSTMALGLDHKKLRPTKKVRLGLNILQHT